MLTLRIKPTWGKLWRTWAGGVENQLFRHSPFSAERAALDAYFSFIYHITVISLTEKMRVALDQHISIYSLRIMTFPVLYRVDQINFSLFAPFI